MIRIKDYIFNEKEINQIKFEPTHKIIVDAKYSNSFIYIGEATFEDIEWNYEDEQIRKCLESIDREEELEEKNKTFEDYNKDLNNQLDKLQQRIDKAIKSLEEDYFEDGSGNNVEEVIKTLKGEEEK